VRHRPQTGQYRLESEMKNQVFLQTPDQNDCRRILHLHKIQNPGLTLCYCFLDLGFLAATVLATGFFAAAFLAAGLRLVVLVALASAASTT